MRDADGRLLEGCAETFFRLLQGALGPQACSYIHSDELNKIAILASSETGGDERIQQLAVAASLSRVELHIAAVGLELPKQFFQYFARQIRMRLQQTDVKQFAGRVPQAAAEALIDLDISSRFRIDEHDG